MRHMLGFAVRGAGLVFALATPSCERARPAEAPAAPALVHPATPPAPVADVSGVSWKTDARSAFVPEIQGAPVKMAGGEHCKTFRRLPTLRFTEDTLISDACLMIPDNTIIGVRDGVTLAIVATNGLSLGKNVIFDARGTRGRRGKRATFASIAFNPPTDREIQALCVDDGNRCACPTAEGSLAAIRGHTGENGSPGGKLLLVAAELLSPSKLSGFGIDVSGGSGGPPGESGINECARGSVRCASPACSAGVEFGATGTNGNAVVAIGGAMPAEATERIKAASVRPESTTLVFDAPAGTFPTKAAELDRRAVVEGWQRRAGADTY